MKNTLRKSEIFGIITILVLILFVSYLNYLNSLRRQRDFIRLIDMGNVVNALELYKKDYGFYPRSTDDGKIIACFGEETDVAKDKNGKLMVSSTGKWLRINLVSCEWGKDPIESEVYLEKLPHDPKDNEGVIYVYESDGNTYKLYGAYESRSVAGFDKNILELKKMCGTLPCSSMKMSQ